MAYILGHQHTGQDVGFSTTNYTWTWQIVPEQDMFLSAVSILPSNTGTGTLRAVLYSDNGNLLASSGGAVSQAVTKGVWKELSLTTPYLLTAGTVYRVGMYTNGTSPEGAYGTWGGTDHVHTSSPSGLSVKFRSQYHSASGGDIFPQSIYTSHEFIYRLTVDPPNAAPNATVTAPAASSQHDPRLPINVAWTYSDAEGSPQAQWEVAWKLAANSTYTVISTAANANTSYTIPANTLPDESDVDIRVRVNDGTAWSTGTVVRIRSDSWTYGPEATTATHQVDVGPVGTSGDYQAQVRTADVYGFSPWSAETVTFLAADTLAADVDAVPAGLTLNTAAPTTGVGRSVYFNTHVAPVVAKNLFPNPSIELNAGWWGKWQPAPAVINLTREASGGKIGSSFLRATWAIGGGGDVQTTHTDVGTVAPGQQVRAVVWARASASKRLLLTFWVRDAGGANTLIASTKEVVVEANTWTLIETPVVTAPAGASRLRAHVNAIESTPGANRFETGEYLDLDGLAFTPDSYFDGDSIDPAERYFYRWTGTAHSSTSEKLDTQVARETSLAAPAPTITAENVVWNNAAAEPVVNLIPFDAELTAGSGGAAWGWTLSTIESGGYLGGKFKRLTSNGSPAMGGLYAWTVGGVKPGLPHVLTYRLRGSKSGITWKVSAEWRREDGSLVSGENVGVVASVANEWVEVGGLATPPADATKLTFCMYISNPAGIVSGDTFDFDIPLAVRSNALTSYFDGSTVEGDRNLAIGKAVTVVDAAGNPVAGSNLAGITDGRVDSSSDYGTPNGPGGLLHATVVDLGSVQTIDEVKVWHWHWDGRTYHKTKTQVSRDGVNWITVFDSRTEGEYQELSSGRTYKFAPTGVRYIRDWIHGNTTNGSNHWTEIQAFHRSANTLTYAWNGTPNASSSTRKKTLANNLYVPHPHVGASYIANEDVTSESYILLPHGAPITIYWNGLFAVPAGITLDAVVPTSTVYVMPPVPTYTVKEYQAKFIDGFTRITRRIEILNKDGETLWDDKAGNRSRLITGAVSVDYDRDERRSIDVELANFDNALVHKPGGFWYDKVLRAYRGIEFYDESGRRTYEVPVGTFLIDRVAEARFPKTVKVTGRDMTKRCLLSKFTNATGFEAAEYIEDVIAALAANSGVNNRVMPTTGKTLGRDIIFERGDSRWQAMKEIATAHGYELFFDTQGYLIMREFLDPTLSPVSHEFKTGLPDGNLVTWDKSANDTRIFNHISVIGAEGGSDTIPVWADAYNTNPLSPTNIDELGDRVDTYESALVTTFAQAQDLADTFLKISALEEFEINMQSLVFPWLEAGEIVRFLAPDHNPDEPDRFLLTSFNVPLGLEPMAAVGRRVTIVS